jgi:cell fate (sporulation/competence/biofilm development) regulator YmcA (YheA/YmcA/DUF963 family)
MKIDKDEFKNALKQEFTTGQDLSKLEELLDEYSLVLEFNHSQSDIKSILLDYAMDILEVLNVEEK